MGKIIERCAGIDVGKRFLLCCVLAGPAAEEPQSETRRFDTTVPSLERLRAWFNEEQVTHVVMESTGSYWIPIFNILEGLFTVVLANPEEVKTRKGHKTDRKDAEHLADLLRHNHVRSSYIPPEPVRQLRDLPGAEFNSRRMRPASGIGCRSSSSRQTSRLPVCLPMSLESPGFRCCWRFSKGKPQLWRSHSVKGILSFVPASSD